MSSGGSLRAGQPAALAGIEKFGQASRRYVGILGVAVSILANWQILRATLSFPAYKLLNSWDIITTFAGSASNGQLAIVSLAHNLWVTWLEAALGFALGAVAGFAAVIVSTQSRLLERGLLAVSIRSQTIPILAIAPMAIIGDGQFGAPVWLSAPIE